MMKRLLLLLFLFAGVTMYAENWEPENTFVFMAGILEWDDSGLATYPKKGRFDKQLHDILIERGVPRDNMVFLKDQKGTLSAMKRELTRLVAKSNNGSTLIFYYAGHGGNQNSETCFYNYDTQSGLFSMNMLTDIIKDTFKGNRVILTADCCYSGGLNVVADRLEGHGIGSLVLSSVISSSTSTGAWTFTESLCEIFSGEMPFSGSEQMISVEGAASFIYENMKNVDGQMANHYWTDSFPSPFYLASVNNRVESDSLITRYMEAKYDGTWHSVRIIKYEDSRYYINYLGYDDSWDEWVTRSRLRTRSGKIWKKGSKVDIEWGGKWYPSVVIEVRDIFHLIHYDGWGSEWDEWVTADRMR